MPLSLTFPETQSETMVILNYSALLTTTGLGNDSKVDFQPVVVFIVFLCFFLTGMDPGTEWTKIPPLQLTQSCISLPGCGYIYFVTSKLKLLMHWLSKNWDVIAQMKEEIGLHFNEEVIITGLKYQNLSCTAVMLAKWIISVTFTCSYFNLQ